MGAAGAPMTRDDLHPAVAEALATMDEAGVRWCLLRGAADLRRLDGDVDVLVDRHDLRLLRRGLAEFAQLPAWGRRPHRFFVINVVDEDRWLKLDVVTELCFGRYHELRTRAAAQVLARRHRHGVLELPAPADAFWALLLHTLLDGGDLSPARETEIAELAVAARAGDGPLAAVADAACPPGWNAVRIADTAAAGRVEELQALAPALRAGWAGAGRAARAARARLSVALRRIDRRRPRRRTAQLSGRMTPKSSRRSAG
jgi:hypothetical protein